MNCESEQKCYISNVTIIQTYFFSFSCFFFRVEWWTKGVSSSCKEVHERRNHSSSCSAWCDRRGRDLGNSSEALKFQERIVY